MTDAVHSLPGHRVTLLRDGAEAYPRMLRCIEEARSFVLLETYIFTDDATGRRFAHALTEKARTGIPVRVMYDAVGSKDTPREFFGELRAAGCVVNEYNPISRALFGGVRARRRDHRKLLVVDGTVAFSGGLNIANEYVSDWRDTGIQIEGPVVRTLGEMFVEIWQREERRSPRIDLPPAPPPAGSASCAALSSHVWQNRWKLARAYRTAIDRARQRLWISNAYFVPSGRFLKAIRRAARRGVDVRVIVPSRIDIMPVYYATRAAFTPLLKAGIRLFEWQGAMMHAKTAVIDGRLSTVGSYNIDHLSLLHNLELTVQVEDAGFGAALERMFETDLEHCREVKLDAWRRRPWTQKIAERFFYLFRTLL